MRKIYLGVLLGVLLLSACTNGPLQGEKPQEIDQQVITPEEQSPKQVFIAEEGEVIASRILPPIGFNRIPVEEGSYAEFLRSLPLKPHGSPVLYYNGTVKNKSNVYMAVVDMDIGDRDLQQCADAIIRLRAEYLYGLGEYDKIHFNFTNGFKVEYSMWMEGYRIVVDGNRSYWKKRTEPSNTYRDFSRYMDIIYAYAGTISLEKELISVELDEMEIGDIFIQGGSPGHAVIVVDMSVNEETGEKLFLLAQSYMPAQETQILINRQNESLSPWYSLDFEGDEVYTPEWTFKRSDLKRFP